MRKIVVYFLSRLLDRDRLLPWLCPWLANAGQLRQFFLEFSDLRGHFRELLGIRERNEIQESGDLIAQSLSGGTEAHCLRRGHIHPLRGLIQFSRKIRGKSVQSRAGLHTHRGVLLEIVPNV